MGRPESKRFLAEIVSSKRTGFDVDRLDYFLRDGQSALGQRPDDISINRLMGCARVVEESAGKTTIAYELKLSSTLLDFFKLRARNHKILYQHHTVNLVESMLR